MTTRLLLVALAAETDIVLVRKRTRCLAELIGFETQDQTRITTAVSEIARNAFDYGGGGQIEFALSDAAGQPAFVITVRDHGPGIRDLDAVLNGRHRSAHGMGIGLAGARRLMDALDIETTPGAGTVVRMTRHLPPRAAPVTSATLQRIARTLAAEGPPDLMAELREQTRQIMTQMDELRLRQEELERLNQELQDTNRGVVALYAELDERADHLRQADELKSKFLSHMSHEFRTPLNSILALSRLLLARSDGDLNGEQETQVRFIRKAAENLTELVDDLLDLAKVQAGKTTVSPTEFTASALFGALRGMLRPLLTGDAVALIFEDPVEVPILFSDEAKVSQILRNFISNAVKFTERGEVRVWAAADPDADTVTFHVRDTGIGIDPADLELIFQEFGQVTHPLQTRVKGTGLGLPLSKKLAELLGGGISVQSGVGAGATFSVTLPRRWHAATPPDAEPELPLAADRLAVLVVQADSDAAERVLSGTAYQPVVARSLQQAQGLLLRLRPAALLLDIGLSGDENWRTLQDLRAAATSAGIPLLATAPPELEHKAASLGVETCLRPPLNARTLLDTLDRLTGRGVPTRVLLIEDEEVTRYLVRQLLPASRFSIATANNGADGWALLQRERPDIILLDLNMPVMNGYTFLQRQKDDPGLAGIPVVVLTAAVLDAAQRQRLRSASGIIAKADLSAATLLDAIDAARAVETVP
jgi:signal transduction histidine kinase/CheY-like chemotaxis protein